MHGPPRIEPQLHNATRIEANNTMNPGWFSTGLPVPTTNYRGPYTGTLTLRAAAGNPSQADQPTQPRDAPNGRAILKTSSLNATSVTTRHTSFRNPNIKKWLGTDLVGMGLDAPRSRTVSSTSLHSTKRLMRMKT
ncbi:hypothetical protein G7K_5461-t1 [Saitoella complicata NRRL Y-17804]|uniref:Uncharacterized protein n=1 Tax=Saitoella complicata (strain BCRC 22490 / CBS 7301 / JCM 7358 / NBRC 10748 / NRRL Y-17804) TaxID=698492 RepID=A0A0E9NNF8_SAICN|nr:hypothetical protein G7K_5461-t1 [Saitoella complicata NRRL Y-17804]